MISKVISTAFIVCFIAGNSYSQNYYQLTNGPVRVSAIYHDSLIIAEINQLYFLFIYETNEVYFELPVSSLISNNDTVNMMLQRDKTSEVIFKGKIITEYDITKDHNPLEVNIEGNLEINNKSMPYTFKAFITHLTTTAASCNLSANINIDIKKYFSDEKRFVSFRDVNIIFRELILKRTNQK